MNKITVKIDGIEVNGKLITIAPPSFTGEILHYVRCIKPGNVSQTKDWYLPKFVKLKESKNV